MDDKKCFLSAGAGIRAGQAEVVSIMACQRNIPLQGLRNQNRMSSCQHANAQPLWNFERGQRLDHTALCACRFTEAERINGRWAMAGCAGVLGQVKILFAMSEQGHADDSWQVMIVTFHGIFSLICAESWDDAWDNISHAETHGQDRVIYRATDLTCFVDACRSCWGCSQSGLTRAPRTMASLL